MVRARTFDVRDGDRVVTSVRIGRHCCVINKEMDLRMANLVGRCVRSKSEKGDEDVKMRFYERARLRGGPNLDLSPDSFVVLLHPSIVLLDNPKCKNIGIALSAVTMLLNIIGYVYMNMVWDLASVVLVLEDLSGLRALKRSNDLLKGKRWVGCVTFVVFRGWASALHMSGIGEVVTVKKIGCFLGLFLLGLMGPVVQTVLYFMCKCFYRESVDKVSLRDQLDGCCGRCGRIGGV
ncbi:hypothetical protein Syun_014401 [Stephania yunnanensis]|uniref:Uncharacterized protein n=1 Tax=Stephania yunnanensis TaxID=152371 RepID=A0AAP0PBV6_9MAGN